MCILTTGERFRDDHPGLHCLAETDFVGDQDSCSRSVDQRESGFELVRKDRNVGGRRRQQRIDRRYRFGQYTARHLSPSSVRYDS